MSSPFSNGSTVLDAPMSTRPSTAPQVQQPVNQYFDTQYRTSDAEFAKLRRDIARDAAGERVRDMALRGTWPHWTPEGVRQAVEQALKADRASQAAVQGAVFAYGQWEQQNPHAPDDVRRVEHYRLVGAPATAAEKAAQQLGQVLAQAGEMLETLETQLAIITGDAAERAAEARRHEQATQALDTRLLLARQIAARFGVTL